MPTLTARVKDALSTADEIGVDPVRLFLELLAHRALYLIARSARCDVRWVAADFVVARRGKAPLLTPSTLLAPLAEAGACGPLPSSLTLIDP
jgi:hypothetical protein